MTLAEIVSICLSATALVLSIFQIAKTAWEKREKYKLIVDNIQIIKLPSTPGIILNITIINNSTAPLNITRISYVSKNKDEFLCFLSKKWCGEHYYPQFAETDIPRTERVFSDDFPICIPALGAKSSIVKFEVDSNYFPSDCSSIRLKVAANNRVKESTYTCKDNKNDLTYM